MHQGTRKSNSFCDFVHFCHKVAKVSRPEIQNALQRPKNSPSEVNIKQKILYSYAPTISKRSRLDSDVVAKKDTEALFDDDSDYGSSQCSSKDSPLQIDDEDLHHNRSKLPNFNSISDQTTVAKKPRNCCIFFYSCPLLISA